MHSSHHSQRRRRGLRIRWVALSAAAALVLGACGSDSDSDADSDSDSGAGDTTTETSATTEDGDTNTGADSFDGTLRIAIPSPGEGIIEVWEAAGAAFEEANPDIDVEFNFQEDDLYSTIGLQNLLTGNNAPDIYFEWAGARLEDRVAEGFAADLTEAREGDLGSYFTDGAFNGMEVDGKTVMVPGSADVTTVMWYNTDIFAEYGLEVPETWDEFLDVSATLLENGITPVGVGNKDLWPVGNWSSHIMSRVVGEDVFDQIMRQEISMDSPEVAEGLAALVELQEAGVVNDSANAIDDNEGAELFFQGVAAMHPIGSWLVSWAIETAPDLNFDYFNLPAIDGAGAQDSAIAVTTGYVVNENSDQKPAATAFLELFSSPEFTAQLVEAGGTPLATGAIANGDVDERLARLMEMLQNVSAVVAPPDVGYDLEVANALYAAQAEVLAGVSTPEEAAAEAQRKLGG